MPDIVDIQYDLDPSGYVAGIQQINQANMSARQSMMGMAAQATGVRAALAMITPSRAALGSLGLFAKSAADTQQALAGLEATSAVTGVSTTKLAGSMKQLARDMPVGSQAAQQAVLMFTRVGLAGAGSEGQIAKLAKTTLQLSGATGEGVGALAAGMTNLSRATGNNNLDPKRFTALADAVTTLSANSGSSAENILSFSKNIAPMAQAAGIGTTGILGISTAFAKMGEDGGAATTAVSKMLGDMNKAVQDGSPQLQNYAQILGKTTDQFTQMYKANPADTLSKLTTQIANSGPSGIRDLESIGIEGIRGQRVFQGLIASGGLPSAVQQAQEAYGNGNTEKASEAAFGGLNDELEKLQTSASQVGEAFGQPLLGPLTQFTKMLDFGTGKLAELANSKGGQGVIGAIESAVVAFAGIKMLLGPLSMLGIGRQALTSGGVKSFFAGMGSTLPPGADSRTQRMGGRFDDPMVRNSAGMPGVNRRAYAFGQGWGEARMRRAALREYLAREEHLARQPMGLSEEERQRRANESYAASQVRTPMGTRIKEGIKTGWRYGNMAFQNYQDVSREFKENMYRPAEERQQTRFFPRFENPIAQFKLARDDAGAAGAGGWGKFTAGLGAFGKEANEAAKATGTLGGSFRSLGGNIKATGMLFTQLARDGAGLAGRGLRGAGGALAGAMRTADGGLSALGFGGIGAVAGMGLMWAASQQMRATAQENQKYQDFNNSSISSGFDALREKAGLPTGPSQTFGSLADNLNKNLASGVSTYDQATTVTSSDQQAASGKGDAVNTFKGTPEQIAAQVALLHPGGFTPQEIQAQKIDLLKQMPGQVDTVNKILSQIPQAGGATATGDLGGQAATAIRSLDSAMPNQTNFFKDAWNTIGGNPLQGWTNAQGNSVGGNLWHMSTMSDDQSKALDNILGGINQRYSDQQKYGGDYASQERLKAYNDALSEAAKTGNQDLFSETAKKAAITLTGDSNIDMSGMTMGDFANNGNNLGAFIANTMGDKEKGFTTAFNDLRQKQIAHGGMLDPSLQESPIYGLLKGAAPGLASMFDDTTGTKVSKDVAASIGNPGDLDKLSAALNSMIDAAQKGGMSLTELGAQAGNAASKLAAGTPEFQVAMGLAQRVDTRHQEQMVDLTPAQQARANREYGMALAATSRSNDFGNARADQGQQMVAQQYAADRARLIQRLEAQRQYDIGVQRTNEDYTLQRGYQTHDYGVQVSRTNEQAGVQRARAAEAYTIQTGRAEEQYRISTERAEEDFNTTRLRQQRDFEINSRRAEEDYLTQRSRAIRDFNKQMKRQMEDAADSMYDPFQRIQTKATWDARNLVGNLQEQAEAMRKQEAQLDALRKAGLSSTAIESLGLNKAENAQQVNNLAQDALTDPASVAALNKAAEARRTAGSALYSDTDNKDLKRQVEDFQTSLDDMAKDHQKSVLRSKQDMAKVQNDQLADFRKGMGRTHEDYLRQMRQGYDDYTRQQRQADQDLSRTLKNMATDEETALGRMDKAHTTSLGRMAEDLRNADKTIAGDMKSLTAEVNKALHGQAVGWQKLLVSDSQTLVNDLSSKVLPKYKSVATQFGIDLSIPASSFAGNSAGAQLSSGHASGANQKVNFATGGKIPGHSPHPKADNVPIWATAGEFMQPVDSVQHYGLDVMEALQQKRIPKEAIKGYALGGWINPVGRPPGFPWGHYPSGAVHRALDFPVPVGTPVHAPYAGRVIKSGWSTTGFGNEIEIANSNGAFTILGHNSKLLVPVGAMVAAGKVVSLSGSTGHSTGPHVHMEERWRPYDPMSAFDFTNGAAISAPGGYLPSMPHIDVNQLLKPLNQTKKGWYGRLRESFRARLTAALAAQEAVAAQSTKLGDLDAISGDTTAHTDHAAKNQAIARRLLPAYKIPLSEFAPLVELWNGESGWDEYASNPSSAAYGIPQSLPGSKMGSVANDWRTNPETQIKWGLQYIKERYGSPSKAWQQWNARSPHWYDNGGYLQPGQTSVMNGTGKKEAVLTNEQWSDISTLATAAGRLITQDDLRGVRAASGVHIVVNNSGPVTYDHRNDFGGAQITVQAENPDQMARKLEEKAIAGRITQTRGVRRGA